jgi:hypothetical protein
MGTGTARSPGGGVSLEAAAQSEVPLLLTGVRHHPPRRTDKNLCRCFGADLPSFPCKDVRSFLPHSQLAGRC